MPTSAAKRMMLIETDDRHPSSAFSLLRRYRRRGYAFTLLKRSMSVSGCIGEG